MLSVNVGSANGLMGYNSGWQVRWTRRVDRLFLLTNCAFQVWGGSSPSSQRNPSISSVVSASDIPSFQVDSGYRGPIREGWTSSRPASGTWDEDVNQAQSPHSKDFSQSASISGLLRVYSLTEKDTYSMKLSRH